MFLQQEEYHNKCMINRLCVRLALIRWNIFNSHDKYLCLVKDSWKNEIFADQKSLRNFIINFKWIKYSQIIWDSTQWLWFLNYKEKLLAYRKL